MGIRLCNVLAAVTMTTSMIATAASASQTKVHAIEGSGLFDGELEGASIGGDFRVRSGVEQTVMAEGIAGAVLGVTRAGDGQLYVSTGGPGKVLRVAGGKTEEIYAADKPLVTAVLPVGKSTLVALVAPDAGAEVIELPSKKHARVATPAGVKLLLAGIVVNDVVYAVGGGDDGGVLLKLAPGAKAFEQVATTKEQLRSVAARVVNGKLQIVVGGGDEGIVYAVDGKNVRALLDAAPSEVTSLIIGADGTVFAGFTDGEGKLSKQASARAKDEGSDEEKSTTKKAAPKARKVKGGEVWKIAPSGETRVLFQSRKHGPYALVLDAAGKRVFVGTGPEGRILDLDVDGGRRPGVLARRKGTDEVTALFADKAGLVAGTSHGGGVLFVGTSTKANTAWLSPVLEADGRAKIGAVRVRMERGTARFAVRTGNTKEADDTWSGWSSLQSASAAGNTVTSTPALYAQVKVELAADSEFSSVHVAYLTDNRAPEIASVEVLAPGWKVIANPRDPPETRSVTFGEAPFAKFLDRRGGMNPTLDERPYGKQSYDVGYRTVYAYVEDADKDALRYRFYLGRVQGPQSPSTWQLIKDWSAEPFVSFESSRLADADYRVKVEVDDSPTNGPTRLLGDTQMSAPFVVTHQAPRASALSATRSAGKVRLRLSVEASLPLVSVRCSTGLDDWLPLDPVDGILDGSRESFDVVMAATAASSTGTAVDAVSCEIYDEGLNFARVDVPVR